MTRRGFSLVETMVVVALLGIVTGGAALVMSHASAGARASADEFCAALYLSELADQAAVLRFDDLEPGTHDLKSGGAHRLAPVATATVHLAPMGAFFESRTLGVTALSPRCKRLRVAITYRRPGGAARTVSATVYAGRDLAVVQE
jgi:prepilin-type N-terminal cleavage/methylation domain-containing protein